MASRPRIVPFGSVDAQLARAVQQHAVDLARRAFPGRPLDIRPEPERTCRRAGCDATALSVVLTQSGTGCMAVASITPPGPVESTLLPWAGRIELRSTQIPFRDPPESYVRVKDFAPCASLVDTMRENDDAVGNALRAAAPAG